MPSSFSLLKPAKKDAVVAHVQDAHERTVQEVPSAYISEYAKNDPDAWKLALRELIASDPQRVAALMEREERRQRSSKSGFTLIELSIVLVIIGLIAGGVLVGKDLISAASIRSQITQIEKFNSAANTFFGKYGYLPGDIKDPDASNFGFAPRGTYPGQGDGNGVIEGSLGGLGKGDEVGVGKTVMFWVDLSTAHLIDGSFNTATSTTTPPPTSGSGLSLYFPSAKIGYGNYLYVYSGGANQQASADGQNYYGLSAIINLTGPGIVYSNANIPVKIAYAIDKKIDDGFATSGNVTANYYDERIAYLTSWAGTGGWWGFPPTAATAGTSATCFDNGSVANAPMNYSVEVQGGDNGNCALSFRFQ